jgi:hypothetical protein
MSKWKVVSGAIIQPRYSQQNTKDDPRNQSIAQVLGAIDSVLAPFVGSSPDASQRLHNLDGTVRRAASFALLLLSQPSSWRFDWTNPGSNGQGFMVFPALLQTVNDEAQVLNPPRTFTQAEMVANLTA